MGNYIRSDFARHVLALASGTSLAQAIPVLISPILTRLYSPDEFGVFALYLVLVSILSVEATGRYELAIMLPRKDEDARHLVVISLCIAGCFSVLLALLLWLFSSQIARWLGNPGMEAWLYLLPVGVLVIGAYQTFSFWLSRQKAYPRMGKNRVMQGGLTACGQLFSGWGGSGVGGLMISDLLGRGITTWIIGRDFFQQPVGFYKLRKLALLRRYWHLSKFSSIASVLNTASSYLPVLMLSSFFGAQIVGLYALSQRVLLVPLSVIGYSVGQVFFQQVTTVRDQPEKLDKLVYRLLIRLLMVGIIPFSIITFHGDHIFAFLFGAQWRVAGEYAQYLSVWLLLVFVFSPFSMLFNVLGKEKEYMLFNVVLLASRVLALIVGGLILQDSTWAILLFAISGVVCWGWNGVRIVKIACLKPVNVLFQALIIIVMVFFAQYHITQWITV